MCRLYAFRANDPTRLKCSLVHAQNALLAQSVSDLRGHTHPHGWGVCCYDNAEPWLEKRDTAAHDDETFSLAAERIYARTVLAHIRHATVGVHSAFNSHPFAWGRWSFAHNGTLSGFAALESGLMAETDEDLRAHRMGQTDSEMMFLWLLTRMRRLEGFEEHNPPLEAVMQLLSDSVQELDARSKALPDPEVSRLNFLLTNGDQLYATRFRNSLYIMLQHGAWTCDICGRNHIHGADRPDYRSVTLASEPISRRDWRPVPESSVIGVDADLRVVIEPI